MLTGTDLEGEEDEGEELSLGREERMEGADEEWMEGGLEVDFGFVFAAAAVRGVNACKNNISVSDFAFT